VAFDDCTRVLKLDEDNGKSKLLDVISKPCRQVLDLRLSSDSQHLYCLQSNRFIDGLSQGGDPQIQTPADGLYLNHIDVSSINIDPLKPYQQMRTTQIDFGGARSPSRDPQ
jgi:hypothetical protein